MRRLAGELTGQSLDCVDEAPNRGVARPLVLVPPFPVKCQTPRRESVRESLRHGTEQRLEKS